MLKTFLELPRPIGSEKRGYFYCSSTGYFYCNSTGFYYLQSRYYCPEIGRFVNADAYVSTGHGFLGFNMFAYANNNPVMFSDPDGYMPIPSLIARQKEQAARAAIQRQPSSPDRRVTNRDAQLMHLSIHGFYYNIHGVRINPSTHIQLGAEFVDSIRSGESVVGSWGPAIEAMAFGFARQPELAMSAIIGSNFAEYGFTVVALRNTAIDVAIGYGAGAIVGRWIRFGGPFMRTAIEEAIGLGIGSIWGAFWDALQTP